MSMRATAAESRARSASSGGMELCVASAIGLLDVVREAPHCGQNACLSSTADPQRAQGPLAALRRLPKSKLGTSGRSRIDAAGAFSECEVGAAPCPVNGSATVPDPGTFASSVRGALGATSPVPQSWQNRSPWGFSFPHLAHCTLQGELVTARHVKPLQQLECKSSRPLSPTR